MSKFQVGDAVRVKAGSPDYSGPYVWVPKKEHFGKRHEVIGRHPANRECTQIRTDNWGIEDQCLESWNDAEEWDGTNWVTKKTEAKECFVVKRGDCFPMGEIVSSTNKALARAKSYAEAHPGTEYVVYQEKCSVKRERETWADKFVKLSKQPGCCVEFKDGSKHVIECAQVNAIDADTVSVTYKRVS